MQDINEILPISLNLVLSASVVGFVLFHAFKGMKGNIPGSNKIFIGVISALTFNISTTFFMSFYSYIFPHNIKHVVEVVINLVYLILIMVAAFGFKELVSYSLKPE